MSGHMTFSVEPLTISHHFTMFGVHWSSTSGDNIFNMSHDLTRTCDRKNIRQMGQNSSLDITPYLVCLPLASRLWKYSVFSLSRDLARPRDLRIM